MKELQELARGVFTTDFDRGMLDKMDRAYDIIQELRLALVKEANAECEANEPPEPAYENSDDDLGVIRSLVESGILNYD
jgi:hypothetical protein